MEPFGKDDPLDHLDEEIVPLAGGKSCKRPTSPIYQCAEGTLQEWWRSIETLWRIVNLGVPGNDWTHLPNRTLEALQFTAHLLR